MSHTMQLHVMIDACVDAVHEGIINTKTALDELYASQEKVHCSYICYIMLVCDVMFQ